MWSKAKKPMFSIKYFHMRFYANETLSARRLMCAYRRAIERTEQICVGIYDAGDINLYLNPYVGANQSDEKTTRARCNI